MKRTPRSSPRSGKTQRTVSIVGTGSYVPEKILTNEDLSKMVETDDEWITSRTGIKERRIAADDEFTSDMGGESRRAPRWSMAGITGEEIDLILVATATPDMVFPATACFVQTKIGATKAACLDISAACAGFLFAVEIAQQFIMSHTYDTCSSSARRSSPRSRIGPIATPACSSATARARPFCGIAAARRTA